MAFNPRGRFSMTSLYLLVFNLDVCLLIFPTLSFCLKTTNKMEASKILSSSFLQSLMKPSVAPPLDLESRKLDWLLSINEDFFQTAIKGCGKYLHLSTFEYFLFYTLLVSTTFLVFLGFQYYRIDSWRSS